ncbi:ParA family protein [Deinococcus marmoris]|uniref:ParA family protein n=1 Tax=Deinococcus marmoris TaxID=249408 RepID=UPI00068DB581|nr:ParA family protein [Deinococcus marmoris]
MPKIIAIGNMKGGVGKTTTAVHLAQQLGKKHKVLLLDADEELQCALSWREGDYAAWRFDALPYREATEKMTLNYDYLVIDTKGNEQGGDLVSLAQDSDLLVVPTKPDGLSATGLMKTLAPLVSDGIQNYRVLIVANMGGRGEELREALADQDVPVLNTVVRHSTAVGDAAERQRPLEAYTSHKYAKLVDADYAAVTREILSNVR